ncbi:MAG TPA: DUF4124 domain-containing protein [Burkholderiales bacterium]|nr:DUF4124 domain-containing protein [Burkholderiales bacterium]
MRRLALVVLALAALPAHAQLQKCIDERGRVHYTDKPIPGCKPTAQQPTPLPAKKEAAKPAAKAPAKAAKAAKARPAPPPSAAECKAAREQHEWLRSDRGKGVEMRETRIAQVEHLMRKCR